MNAERLLALFERISAAPDAIPRLRRFILGLALRGKLVEQDPEDEPAEEQLERIIEAKILLGRKERTTKSKRSESSGESLDFPLPTQWATAPLADLATVLNGRAYKQSELLDAGTPVLRVGNLFTSNKWYYSDLELEEDKYCNNGDLIFAWSASFGPFIWNGGRAIYHYHIWKLPLHSPADLSRDYLYLYLLNKTDEIKASGHGISMVHMTKEKMEQLEVPLPPLAEQHRIVAKVDELMALCDQLEAARQERRQVQQRLVAASLQRLNQPAEDPDTFRQQAGFALEVLPRLTTSAAEIKHLRQTILNLAVRGKLVAQDPEDELAEELLRRVGFEIEAYSAIHKSPHDAASKIKAPNEPPFPCPRGWAWAQLCSLFRVITDGDHQPPPKSNEGIAFLTIGNITGSRVDFTSCRFVPESYFKQLAAYRVPESGDILYSVVGATYGRAAIVDADRPFCVQRHIAILKPALNLDSGYLLLLMRSGLIYGQATASLTGSAQPTIALKPLRGFLAPLPPLAEQHRIVAKVDALMALCDQLEQQLNAGEQLSRKLLEAVLQEALGGRLPSGQEESHAAIV